MLDERFVRFAVKQFRTSKDEEWRTIGSEETPAYLYLNREIIKIGGIVLQLEDVNMKENIVKEKIKKGLTSIADVRNPTYNP